MKTNVRYFGMIAEALKTTSEEIDISELNKAGSFRLFFENKYPLLSGMSFQIAINNELTETIDTNTAINEIALLPPFAGG